VKTSLRRLDKDVIGEEDLEGSLAVLPSIVADGTAGGSTIYSKNQEDTAEDGTASGTVDDDCQDDGVEGEFVDGTAAKNNEGLVHSIVKDGSTRS
jgi:hypothetical protein